MMLSTGGDASYAIGDGVDLDQQARAFAQQLAAGFGQARLARAAVEEQHVERFFDLAHAVGQRARHHAGGAGGSGEAAALGDALQHGERVGG